MKTTKLIFKLFLFNLVLISCNDNDKPGLEEFLDRYENGIMISSEGNFGDKDGSLSFVAGDYSFASNFLYKEVNGAQLGGLVQSVAFDDENAYIILNDVSTIVVADRYTLEKKSVIMAGLENPRYMTIFNGKGYITNWGKGADETDDYIAVLDLASNSIEESSKIALDNGVERILAKDNKLYVSHNGGWSSNNIISVIDLVDNSVGEITVNDNPDDIFFTTSGDLVVLCKGKPLVYGDPPNYDVVEATTSSISFVDVSTKTVFKSLEFSKNIRGTIMSYSEGNIYYYSDNRVYKISETATELGADGLDVGDIYGMRAKNDKLYTLEYAFSELSKLRIIDYETESDLYATAVGLGASKIYFN